MLPSSGVIPAVPFVSGMTDLLHHRNRIVVKGVGDGDFVHDVKVGEGEHVSVVTVPSGPSWSSPVRREDDWTPVKADEKKRFEDAKATKSLRDYRRIEVSNFLNKSEELVPPEHLFALFGSLLEEIEDRKALKGVTLATNYSKPKSQRWFASADSGEPTLILSGVITEYEKGSRAKRYFVGFGSGKTKLYCLFRLVDKTSGEVVLEKLEEGSVAGGLFGGSGSGAAKQLGENIAKAINKNWDRSGD